MRKLKRNCAKSCVSTTILSLLILCLIYLGIAQDMSKKKSVIAPIPINAVIIDTEFTHVEQQAISATRKLLSPPLARKIVQFMKNEHSAQFVLPEGTKLDDNVCLDVAASRECASAATWSRQSVLGNGCDKVFLDVGANIGMHARFLFQPDLYKPKHPYSEIFDTEFGVKRTQDPWKQCVVAFEPNPKHRERHQKLATAYARQGWKYRVFYAAVRGYSRPSSQPDTLDFYLNDNHTNNDWGFSIGKLKSDTPVLKVQVPTLDLSRFIFEHIANAEIPPQRVLMKMDIEGSEYAVLSHMLATDSFSHIDLLTIEFHSWKNGFNFQTDRIHISHEETIEFMTKFPVLLNTLYNTTVKNVDDESFLFDGQSLP